MNKGFTLVEILIAVLIMGVLVTMAVPMYEKTIEKSRIAEARAHLKRIYDAKIRLLDDMEQTTYNFSTPPFGFENLDFAFDCTSPAGETPHKVTCSTDDFKYVLNPTGSGNQNFVCAVRRRGDYAGVNFLFTGQEDTDKFFCNNGGVTNGCDVFGMPSNNTGPWCTNS